jgi:hypothetical protein
MDLSEALINLVNNLVGPFWRIVFALGACLGIWYTFHVGMKLIKANNLPGQPAVNGGELLVCLVIATCLFHYSGFMQRVAGTMSLGTISYSALDYPGASNFGKLAPAVNAVLTLASMAGGGFAFKGLLLIRRASSGGGHAGDDLGWKGATHVFGGAALINIVQTIELFRQSAGGLW